MSGSVPYDELTSLDDPLAPGEAGVTPFGPVAGGVGVGVVVRDDTDVTRDRVATSLEHFGVPLAELRLVTEAGDLRHPFPWRCDLRNLGFRPTEPSLAEVRA